MTTFSAWWESGAQALQRGALAGVLNGIERALNHLLRDEAWARQALQGHAGKTVQLHAAPFALQLRVTEPGFFEVLSRQEDANETSQEPPTPADLSLTVALSQLPSLALQKMPAVRVEGDAEFATVINQLVRHLRWDVEEDLSRVVGDMAAHRLVNTTRSVAQQMRRSAVNFVDSSAEYFSEEAGLLASRTAVENFSAQVRELRDDVERFLKRIEKQEAFFQARQQRR